MFEKVLIANRGEIALRGIRACKSLGISPVVVYSNADAYACYIDDNESHILEGDNRKVYLDIGQILDIAKKTESEAIFPGYGYLSENPDFAKACEEQGITFIGPSSETIKMMGDKAEARRFAESIGIPLTKGTGAIKNLRQALSQSKTMEYPLKIAAIAGGGGRGIRVVKDSDEFKGLFQEAQREGQDYFDNPLVNVQEYIPEIRHVEVQILADRHGNVVHFGTRDCSVQRRYQKLVEEAPAPCLDEKIIDMLQRDAVKAAKESGYHGAGTVEYMVYGNRYSWGEMNTRIQVEHPISEEISRVRYKDSGRSYKPDLVKLMILVATGEPLEFDQDDIFFQGHSIECRINAEDPNNGFFPSTELLIEKYHEPHDHEIRVESCLYEGYEIPHFYDSMIAKLVTYGEDRERAISMMKKALHRFKIEGISTTIPFHEAIMRDPVFIEGGFSTEFLTTRMNILKKNGKSKIDEVYLNLAHGCYEGE